jgi:hypothetical protein
MCPECESGTLQSKMFKDLTCVNCGYSIPNRQNSCHIMNEILNRVSKKYPQELNFIYKQA